MTTALLYKKRWRICLLKKYSQTAETLLTRCLNSAQAQGFCQKICSTVYLLKSTAANDIIEESEFCIKNIINDAKFVAGEHRKNQPGRKI